MLGTLSEETRQKIVARTTARRSLSVSTMKSSPSKTCGTNHDDPSSPLLQRESLGTSQRPSNWQSLMQRRMKEPLSPISLNTKKSDLSLKPKTPLARKSPITLAKKAAASMLEQKKYSQLEGNNLNYRTPSSSLKSNESSSQPLNDGASGAKIHKLSPLMTKVLSKYGSHNLKMEASSKNLLIATPTAETPEQENLSIFASNESQSRHPARVNNLMHSQHGHSKNLKQEVPPKYKYANSTKEMHVNKKSMAGKSMKSGSAVVNNKCDEAGDSQSRSEKSSISLSHKKYLKGRDLARSAVAAKQHSSKNNTPVSKVGSDHGANVSSDIANNNSITNSSMNASHAEYMKSVKAGTVANLTHTVSSSTRITRTFGCDCSVSSRQRMNENPFNIGEKTTPGGLGTVQNTSVIKEPISGGTKTSTAAKGRRSDIVRSHRMNMNRRSQSVPRAIESSSSSESSNSETKVEFCTVKVDTSLLSSDRTGSEYSITLKRQNISSSRDFDPNRIACNSVESISPKSSISSSTSELSVQQLKRQKAKAMIARRNRAGLNI